MKNILSLFFSLSLVLSLFLPATVFASNDANPTYQKIVVNEETYYLETIITENDPNNSKASSTKTATKTVSYLDADQNTLWSLSVTATFVYDNVNSQCVSCSHQAISYDSHWIIKSSSSSYSGNSATATATATQTDFLWNSHDFTAYVSIYCSPTGVIS
ncbi:MAG: hypothetical protein J6W66_01670 [Lachnospiraceae bacterium]|nr:hypothetical protein [Lachnospiraceae bacterium]MBP5732526.1 hypothetical protein [Lachnospiraceae bacterium]